MSRRVFAGWWVVGALGAGCGGTREVTEARDTGSSGADTAATDTSGVEPSDTDTAACDPAACPPAPAPVCADATTVSVSEPACDEAGDCTLAVSSLPCGAFEGCSEGTCAPLDLCEVSFDAPLHVGTLTSVRLAGGAADGDACCTDFTGDGLMDNRLGLLTTSLDTVLGLDSDAVLAEILMSGVRAWTYVISRPDAADPGRVDLDLLPSRVADGVDQVDIQTGEGVYVASRAGFGPDGTYAPTDRLSGRLEADGTFVATGTLSLPMPLVGLLVEVPIVAAELEGQLFLDTATAGAVLDGRTPDDVDGARLSGVVSRDALFGAVSEAFAAQCACAAVSSASGQLFDEDGRCGSVDLSACAGLPEADVCDMVARACPGVRAVMTADLDTNADGVADALSAGWWLRGTRASLLGVEGCTR